MKILTWTINLFKNKAANGYYLNLKGVHSLDNKKVAGDLLKEATSKKIDGDLEGAIALLREAYSEIGKDGISYPIETFLRLPLYLQEVKRTNEAWEEFNILLTKGYPNQLRNLEFIPMEHCRIYDKMRLFLQREGRPDKAIRYGIFSYLSWAIGLYRQKRKEELNDYIAKNNYEETIKKLLKKAKKEALFNKICMIVREQIDALPNIDFTEVSKKLEVVE